MNLKDYFEKTNGRGILATAAKDGVVNAAVYSKPHVVDENNVAFIMRQRLTHSNLQENPYATYLFMEGDQQSKGVRLYLRKTGEEKDSPLIETLKKRRLSCEEDKALGPKYLAFFTVERVLPLLGGEFASES